MDDYLLAPDYDEFENSGAVLIDAGRDEPWVSPENIESYVGTRTFGGVA